MADSLDLTARTLLACVGEALEDAQRPVCASYATVGPPVIGPMNCCECGGGQTGEATINFERLYDANPETLQQVTPVHPCKRTVTVADFSIVLTRCYPRIDESGQMPSPDEVDEASALLHEDVRDIYAALTCTCSGYRLIVQEVAVNAMPEAGCSVIASRVSVEVDLRPLAVPS